ncbi:Uncharacterized protein FKW44_011543 [Caligus rogercresseyi]|uniref:Uncharacterized protein n=1 Tax=Caligus rogercresseyi TaxID=217165 RepID=A0A7T8HIG1_CALRO|nr:Uncharacterized protein FKW44_011543 [Caligus rogercresseyi]|eukprot:TRINITY_DN825_c0_g1_i1.p1 TRINITY_DN825_c0_g1~~TRINITY_DN825_c0_g1_i1.p1  ORF type:complete len:171 (-),score=39.13 TRINITY_DN825_c0_g1_i1:234-746(-)
MRGLFITGALLASLLVISESTIVLPAITLGTGALAGLAILKIAALKTLALGSLLAGDHRRGRRSLSDLESSLLSASQNDASDCAKRLICEVNGALSASAPSSLSSEEAMIMNLFNSDHLDISSLTVEFDLAAQIGRRVGSHQCGLIYKRCPHSREELMEILQDPNFASDL